MQSWQRAQERPRKEGDSRLRRDEDSQSGILLRIKAFHRSARRSRWAPAGSMRGRERILRRERRFRGESRPESRRAQRGACQQEKLAQASRLRGADSGPAAKAKAIPKSHWLLSAEIKRFVTVCGRSTPAGWLRESGSSLRAVQGRLRLPDRPKPQTGTPTAARRPGGDGEGRSGTRESSGEAAKKGAPAWCGRPYS